MQHHKSTTHPSGLISVPIFRGGFQMARRNRCLQGTQLSDGGSKILHLGASAPPNPPVSPEQPPSQARVFRIGAPMTFGENQPKMCLLRTNR